MTKTTQNASNAKKPKAQKKKILLTKPKRPMSAYNFFFKRERAKILANDSSTDFGAVGRMIGQRWRDIAHDHDELAKFKDLADADSVRYKAELKTYHTEELRLMCLGHTGDEDQQDGAKSKESGLLPAAQDGGGLSNDVLAAPSKETKAAAKPDQTNVVAAAAAATADPPQDVAGRGQPNNAQTLLAANEQLSAAAASMMNPTAMNPPNQNAYLQNIAALGSLPAFDPNPIARSAAPVSAERKDADRMDDQVLQLSLQHLQSSTPTFTNETIMNFITSQQASLKHRQQRLAEELKTLQLKSALFDNVFQQVKAAVEQQGSHNQGVNNGHHPAVPAPMEGMRNAANNDLLTQEQQQQLLPLLQQQIAAVNPVLSAILGGNQAQAIVGHQPLNPFTMVAPAPDPPAALWQGQLNQPSLSSALGHRTDLALNVANGAAAANLADLLRRSI